MTLRASRICRLAKHIFPLQNESKDMFYRRDDGREKGGTVSTLRMVYMKRKELREIPLKLYVTRADLTR